MAFLDGFPTGGSQMCTQADNKLNNIRIAFNTRKFSENEYATRH